MRYARGGWLVAAAIAITTGLWVAGRWDLLGTAAFWFWLVPAQLTMLWSAALACLAILAVVRAQALEPLFGGLDRAVRLHRRLGLAALILLVLHVLFLAVDAASKTGEFLHMLVPFWSAEGRVVDILMAFPGILLNIAIVATVARPGVGMVIAALVANGWVGYARVARGQAAGGPEHDLAGAVDHRRRVRRRDEVQVHEQRVVV